MFATSEVAQLVPISYLVQVCWRSLVARDFDSDSAVTLETMAEFVSDADLYFAVKCEKYD